MAKYFLDLKEILHELAGTVGREYLHNHIDNLDGNIAATPPPPDQGEAEKVAAQIAELQKRQAEIAGTPVPETGKEETVNA